MRGQYWLGRERESRKCDLEVSVPLYRRALTVATHLVTDAPVQEVFVEGTGCVWEGRNTAGHELC